MNDTGVNTRAEASYFTELAIKSYMNDYKVDRNTALKEIFEALDKNMNKKK